MLSCSVTHKTTFGNSTGGKEKCMHKTMFGSGTGGRERENLCIKQSLVAVLEIKINEHFD